MSEQAKKTKMDNSGKKLARLAAVQSLYQMVLVPLAAKTVIAEFRANPRIEVLDEKDGHPTHEVDFELYGTIVAGATEKQAELDEMINAAFSTGSSADRIETLLRSILRAGVYELHHQGATATGIIINDYVDVAHAFYDGKEPGLVNGMLDRLAKKLRAA